MLRLEELMHKMESHSGYGDLFGDLFEYSQGILFLSGASFWWRRNSTEISFLGNPRVTHGPNLPECGPG